MTDGAKKEQKKAAKESGKGFKDSFKDTVRSVKSAGKTLLNATGINGKQKKEQAVDKIYGITRGIGTAIAHPIRSIKEIASGIKKKAKEKGESYVGGYILGELTQTVATAGAAAAAGKGLKGAKAAKKTKPKKKNGLADAGSKSGIKTVKGYDAKVNVGQQNKHIPGTNEYKNALNNGQTKSILYGDINDIQSLLNQKAGTGKFLGTNKERVDFGKVIGQYIDPETGIGVETTKGIIHYGKNGAHIVPARPN